MLTEDTAEAGTEVVVVVAITTNASEDIEVNLQSTAHEKLVTDLKN